VKLSRTVYLTLGIGAVIIVFFILFVNYNDKIKERDSLLASIDKANKALPSAIAQKQSLEAQKIQLGINLNLSKFSLTKAQSAYKLSVNSVEYGEEFFKIAGLSNVQLQSISTSLPARETLEGVTYMTMDVELNITGDLEGVTAFVHKLAADTDLDGISVNSIGTSLIDESALQVQVSLRGFKYQSE
jgi:hypothetical protein